MLELEEIFRPYRPVKIAIYGLSPLTETVLNQLAGYHIVGLLDGYRTEGTLYNRPILPFKAVVQSGVRLIIIAARPESCKVIAKRIGASCEEHGISLLDIHGKDLCVPPKAVYELTGVPGVTKAQLTGLFETHDTISVDLFDTLLMRQTLFPTDVFEIVDLRLKEKGVIIEDFSRRRLEAEKELVQNTIPTLLEIYTYLLEKYSVPGVDANELTQMEYETDRDLTIPRKELCGLLQKVSQQGKPIYIVSDTFYTKSQLAGLLKNCGITWYTDILSSCDYRTGKTQWLFNRLRERLQGKTCLHIGDAADADIKSARQSGLTACQLYSGLELFERTGYLGVWEQIHSLSSRIQTGMFVSRLFNNPFQFEEPGQKLSVDSAYEIGYLFFAPLISGFVIWLYRQIHKCGLKNVWFCARDGYLIKKLFDQLDNSVNSVYFLTSRTAAIRAGMENEADIQYVEEMRFSGSVQDQLKQRFGLSVECVKQSDQLADYTDAILHAAEIHRRNYQTYLNGLKMAEGDIAFFDFVARGTVQMYIGRMLDRHLKGFYFLWQDQRYMREKGLDVLSFCQEGSLAQNYYILETVLTSPKPSISGFDKDGRPCFAVESRTERDLKCVQEIQSGILDYFQAYLRLNPDWKSTDEKDIAGLFLSLIHEIQILDKGFLMLKIEDPFFHRMTDMSDLI